MNILLDLDGVLVKWSLGVIKLAGLDPYSPVVQKFLREDVNLRIEDIVPNVNSLVEDGGYDFWYNLELAKYSKEMFDRLRAIPNCKVIFCTNPGHWNIAATAKLDVIKTHFDSTDCILIKDKYLLANRNTLLIDDMEKQVGPFSANGGYVYKWPNIYKLDSGEISFEEEMTNLEKKINWCLDQVK